MTESIFAEGQMHPDELSPIHIVMLRKDEQVVRDALKEVPRAQRPQLSLAKLTVEQTNNYQHRMASEAESAETRFEIVEERTFISMRPVSSTDSCWHSAPARLSGE